MLLKVVSSCCEAQRLLRALGWLAQLFTTGGGGGIKKGGLPEKKWFV